jgi:multicomponent Na+:H+ antiporter subunit D
MNPAALLPLSILLTSALTGSVILVLREDRERLRTWLNLGAAALKFGLVLWMLWGVFHQQNYTFRVALGVGLELLLVADSLAVFFGTLSASLWLVTTLYAVGYLSHDTNRSRFFGFFSWCVTSTAGIALAGNLVTFFLFYELLTLSTYPLVVHRETPEALRVGRLYLAYTLGGSALVLVGIAWLYTLAGPLEFRPGGALSGRPLPQDTLRIIGVLLIAGLGVKSAIVPLHSWLPRAMVAPAPVSALLHAVAVVKAGAFGLVRISFEVYGVGLSAALGLSALLSAVAALTIVYGSVCALRQQDLKRRLAYSTVSQVSYIALGVSLGTPLACLGGIAHLVHQGLMKITLFFCAGNYAEQLGVHRIDEMDGIGRRMPLTTVAFTVGSLGMVGVPPTAGFVSKWYLGIGAFDASQPWVVVVLVASTLLNAAYFLPILHRAWFSTGTAPGQLRRPAHEASLSLLAPPLLTAGLVVLAGVFAEAPPSPLQWAELIVDREFR